ncbi:hypothetical protein CROQUDRAFT_651883 [Cronartium quercuum f. sp. fusiforme G11]|uniref:Uncharacterized protein n=1 Tax=Cronartium quercuum f. sp. fusiforme G11 TaxID=708437 RepID=A0A9P6TGF3_9BASI|nr:hypothetical protein CROQUDRAFT_651883 [Cronartium quercuum f. sp. fusiforme G11]
MLPPTHLLTLIFILASLTVSAVFVKTKGHKCTLTYYISQNTSWANGTFYNEDGVVAINTRQTGSNISFFENNIKLSSIPASGASCYNLTVQDSHGVRFSTYINYTQRLYTWRFQGPIGPSFVWKLSHSKGKRSKDKHSKDKHSKHKIRITGVVTEEGKTQIVAKTSVAKPDKVPNVFNGKGAYRIEIVKSAGANDVPDRLELMELLYLLSMGPRSCPTNYQIITSSFWPDDPDLGEDSLSMPSCS